MRLFVVKAIPLSHLRGGSQSFEGCCLSVQLSNHSRPTQHSKQHAPATLGSPLTPHLLPAEAYATVFKLTILKPLKRAWQAIYSAAKDSNFIVQRQETQLHWKICTLREHRFNKTTVPRVCARNSWGSSIPFLKLPGTCFFTQFPFEKASKGPPQNKSNISAWRVITGYFFVERANYTGVRA